MVDAANDRDMYKTLDVITELCWQCHLAWENIIGEEPQDDWGDLHEEDRYWLKQSVEWILQHPTASISSQHDAWRSRELGRGLRDGHPNLVAFDELPWPQQMKARLWRHVIMAVIG
jgi:hypothetical protein